MDIATLGLRVDGDAATRQLREFGDESDRTGGKVASLERGVRNFAATIATGFIAREVLQNIIDAQNEMARMESAVRSTGGAAGFTVEQLTALSESLQQVTTFSSGAVQSGLSRLLTYTGITGDMFKQASVAALDMASALGIDVASAAERTGNALQYPSEAINSLTRQGFRFTDQQKATIAAFEQSGQLAKAQAVILGELTLAYGGAAEAARNTLGGALSYLKNEFTSVGEVSAESTSGITQAINGLGDAMPGVRRLFNEFFGGIQLLAVDAAIGVEKITLSVANLQNGLGQAVRQIPGLGAVGDWLLAGSAKMAPAAEATVVALEAWRKEQYALILGIKGTTDAVAAHAGVVAQLHPLTAEQIRDAKALQKATDDYYNTLNQHAVDAVHSVATMRADNEQARAMIEATRLGQEAVDALTVAQAGANAVRELGLGVSGKLQEAVRAEAEEQARLAVVLRETGDAQKAAAEETKRANDEIAQAQERQLHGVLQTAAGAFQSFFSDIFENGKGMFQSLWDAVKQGFARLIGDLLAMKLESKLAGMLTAIIPVPGHGGIADASSTGWLQSMMLNHPGVLPAAGGAIAGFGLGYGSQNAGLGAVGGAGAAAALGAGPMGIAAGALAGFVGGIVGAGAAAREAAKQQEVLRKAYKDTQAQIAAQLSGDALAVSEAQIKSQFDAYREQAKAAAGPMAVHAAEAFTNELYNKLYAGGTADIKAQLAQLAEWEDQAIANARELASLQLKQTSEDLHVRLLAAEGRDKEASALQLQLQQQRERDALLKSFGPERSAAEDATLALLDQVQAQEKLKAATDAASQSALNMVEGYKLQLATFNVRAPGMPASSFGGSQMQPPTSRTESVSDATPIVLQVDGAVLFKSTVGELRKAAQAKGLSRGESYKALT